MIRSISVGARGSPLSRKQVEEIERDIKVYHPDIQLIPTWITTSGDKDKVTSLLEVNQTDFFTKEIEELQLKNKFQISIHSAKDLPTSLRQGLEIAAITIGVDKRDVLVFSNALSWENFPKNAKIGTSSLRRKAAITNMCASFIPVDIRGNIGERLKLIETGVIDGVIMAEAALIRLGLTHLNRIFLDIEPEPLQGQLAIVIREGDTEMRDLFQVLDIRHRDPCLT